MHFTELDLSKPIQEALSALGYEETTPIQTQAIPPGLQKRDIVGCAQTGTGKTLAFLLPALDRLLRDQTKIKNPRVVVLEPTRELAIQVAGETRKLTARTSLRSVPVYGGAGMKKQTDKLRRGVDVVVATPGRLMDHMRRKNVSFRDLQILVLDEADRMLDMGFLPRHQTDRQPYAPSAPNYALLGHDTSDDFGSRSPVSARPGEYRDRSGPSSRGDSTGSLPSTQTPQDSTSGDYA